MPEAFNAGIVYRLPSRTRGLSMLRPRTAPAKHFLLPGPPSPAALLAADADPRPRRAGSTSTQASSNVTRVSQPKSSVRVDWPLSSWS